jgi:hypothetical protein
MTTRKRIEDLLRSQRKLAVALAEQIEEAKELLRDFESPPKEEILHVAHYDPATKHWSCPFCKKFHDLQRRSVTTHMRFCEGAAK